MLDVHQWGMHAYIYATNELNGINYVTRCTGKTKHDDADVDDHNTTAQLHVQKWIIGQISQKSEAQQNL